MDKDKVELPSGIANDLNNLLLIIRNYATLMNEDVSENSRRTHLQELKVAVDRATKLAAQIHAINRTNAERVARREAQALRAVRLTDDYRPTTSGLELRAD